MFGPRSRISPSSAILISSARQRAADRAEAVAVDRRDGRRRRGLGHAEALEHRHAAGEEELEDLLRDRRRAGRRLAQVAAERRADVLEQLLLGRVEVRLQLLRHLLARRLQLAHLQPDLRRPLDLLGVAVRGDERVELLEDPRHRRQVGRLDLGQLRDDLLRVAAEVGQRRAQVEDRELDQQRERVREREEQVGDVAGLDDRVLLDHRHDVAVVAVAEHAALRRPGRARRVDDRVRLVARDGVRALAQLGGVAAAAALAHVGERDRRRRRRPTGRRR